MRKGRFGRTDPKEVLPRHCFSKTENSFSKLVHLSVKKLVLGSSEASKAIMNTQNGILGFTECFHEDRLSPQLRDIGGRDYEFREVWLSVQGHTGSQPLVRACAHGGGGRMGGPQSRQSGLLARFTALELTTVLLPPLY